MVQSLTGRVCSVKMLRDRYRKWGINDKNARPHRVAVATSNFTTQTALLHSPRIVELNEDESPVAQEPASTRTEHDLFTLRMVASELRPGSPRAALLSLDPKVHEILTAFRIGATVRQLRVLAHKLEPKKQVENFSYTLSPKERVGPRLL
jgi:hypothetical protein